MLAHWRSLVFFLVSCWGCLTALADVRLPAILSSNMVLQQSSKTRFWGWSQPGEKIQVTHSWDGKTDSAQGNNEGRWECLIATPKAGGPFTITVKGNNTITLENVLAGEVWLCSGQSNMEWSIRDSLTQLKAEQAVAANPSIRFFHIPRATARFPQDWGEGRWVECTPQSLETFSAVGYYFGKKLQETLGVPVGLINASWGGTPAEVWTPSQVVLEDSTLAPAGRQINPSKWWPNKPGATYNAMIHPVHFFDIAGVIWYQGESNTSTASTYRQLFTSMIDAWRNAWNKPFPFYYVQIAPFNYGEKLTAPYLREAQEKTLSHPGTGMAVITDLVDNVKDIHPQNKRDAALRLANWALAETYGKTGLMYKSPVYSRMQVSKDKALLYFDNTPGGLVIRGKQATELFVAGADSVFHPAQAKWVKDRLEVWSAQVKQPVAVRFGFSNAGIGNLFAKEGLPVSPFRTDSW